MNQQFLIFYSQTVQAYNMMWIELFLKIDFYLHFFSVSKVYSTELLIIAVLFVRNGNIYSLLP